MSVNDLSRKDITKQKLVGAVGKILSKEGFRGMGINKVARIAGVDKVLVYRYFGGLPELIWEYSRTVDFWPTADELIGENFEQLKKLAPDMQVAAFFKSFLYALRQRPITQDILAWELLERNELSKQLEQIRIKSILEYFERFKDIPDEDDLSAIIVLMGGAINHLIIKSRINNSIGGIDLECDEGWDRINRGIDLLLTGIFKQ